MKDLKDFNFENKKVLVRVDFNVSLSDKGSILDDFRIKKAIPTIKYLAEKGAKIILISHLGRPYPWLSQGISNFQFPVSKKKEYSLKPIVKRLEKLLNNRIRPVKSVKKGAAGPQFNRVRFLDDCIGDRVEKETGKIKSGEIILLENLRFYKEEEKNDKTFARKLSRLATIFINDAFSVCHRAHASVVGITKYLPSAAGFLLEKEIKALSQVVKRPKRPLVVIIGGKKIDDKAKVAEKFSKMADSLLVGDLVADEIKKGGISIKEEKIIFPVEDKEKFDISPKTVKIFKSKIKKAKTIFWAGPLGKVEEKKYQKGTRATARAIIESGAFSVIGGGDTLEFINKAGLAEKFSHVSTGGGAMLDFLAGEKMPGIEVLK